MHRIDAEGHLNNRFTDGNPAAGQLATLVDADWLNAIQEGPAKVIEYAGIALEKGDDTQLLDAIIAIAAGVIGAGGGAVPTTRTVTGGGLVTGGGALAANIALSVAAASAAEVAAGTEAGKAVTPAALAAGFSGGAADNGYIRLPGGIIVQWGQLRGAYVEGGAAVTFPITFTDRAYAINATAINQAGSNAYNTWAQIVSRSASGFTAYFQWDSGGTNSIAGLDYIAIGK